MRPCDLNVEQRRRVQAFRAAHPEWRIGFDHCALIWQAWRVWPDGCELHCRYAFDKLLDYLDAQTAQRAGAEH